MLLDNAAGDAVDAVEDGGSDASAGGARWLFADEREELARRVGTAGGERRTDVGRWLAMGGATVARSAWMMDGRDALVGAEAEGGREDSGKYSTEFFSAMRKFCERERKRAGTKRKSPTEKESRSKIIFFRSIIKGGG